MPWRTGGAVFEEGGRAAVGGGAVFDDDPAHQGVGSRVEDDVIIQSEDSSQGSLRAVAGVADVEEPERGSGVAVVAVQLAVLAVMLSVLLAVVLSVLLAVLLVVVSVGSWKVTFLGILCCCCSSCCCSVLRC